MKATILSIAAAGALFALSANAQHPHSGASSSSQTRPSDSAATPPGQSSQGSAMGGSTTGDSHGQMGQGMGHGMGHGQGGMDMGFSQMDRNKDGQISREEWNAMHGSGAGSAGGASGTSQPGSPPPSGASRK